MKQWESHVCQTKPPKKLNCSSIQKLQNSSPVQETELTKLHMKKKIYITIMNSHMARSWWVCGQEQEWQENEVSVLDSQNNVEFIIWLYFFFLPVMMTLTEEDYEVQYWPKLKTAIDQLLNMKPGAYIPISYEQMYRFALYFFFYIILHPSQDIICHVGLAR